MQDMICVIDVFLLFLLFVVVPDGRAQTTVGLPYQNSQLSSAERAEDLLNRMTLAEKADLVAGTGFDSKPLPRSFVLK